MRPIRAARLGTATALVALLACAPAASAGTDTDSAHAKGGDRVITLIGHLVQQTRLPVNPGGSPAQGDRTVFRSLLFDKDDKNQVGETDGTCTTTTVENGGSEVCIVTYNLPGGQLSVQGMVFGILTDGRPTIPPPSFDNGITGGTGDFRQARGQVHADTIGTGKRRFTIYLDR
ncbi:allene oxide cyclase barrel-like domain-containing protein [Streptomyces sp. Tue6028]|uniref:allene oxide cyclase barrel-like domain-containing protein n=1 Tax=Streptomyces sp. Tue6028 TaxID=2036037 RepID=UPI003D71CB4F